MQSKENGHHRDVSSINYGTATENGMDKQQDAKTEKIYEIVSLIATIGLAWMLLILPIIFYHLPDEVYLSKMPMLTTTNMSTTECSSAIPYPENGVCQSVLEGTLLSMNCESGESLSVLRDEESNARLLFFALSQETPSPECIEAAAPLLCLHLFGLCDSSGVSIQPTSGQCRNVRDNICSREWQAALMNGLALPDCSTFPEQEVSCPGSNSGFGNFSSSEAVPLSTSSPSILSCREDFIFSQEEGICIANCHTWSEFTPSVAVSTDVITALSGVVGFISGVAVIAISLLRFKKVFMFPSIFIVYMTCDVLVIAFFIIITYFDRPSLYCKSENVGTSLEEPTPFCVITGIAFTYIVLQLAIWWLFHTSALLWKVGFPLHARSFDKSGKTKYIHIACVIVGIVVPLIPLIALMANFASEVGSTTAFASGGLGFNMGRFPPILCSGGDSAVVYYSVILPINLIFFPGITELILLFAVVHKQHGLFREKKSRTSHFKIGTPERKILVALCYYVLLLIIAIPAFTLATRISGLFSERLEQYFVCEALGVDPNNPGRCDEFIDNFRAFSNPELTTTAFVLISLFPTVFLIYTVNFEELKEKWMNFRDKRSGTSSQFNSEMHKTRDTTSH